MEEKFEYNYSAATAEEKKEAEAIRARYLGESAGGKLERLKSLDNKVKQPPMIWSLSLGIIGTLIFGLGLAMILEFRQIPYNLVWGTLISTVGLVPIALAYPVYQKVLEQGKAKYGAEILRLTEEILGENEEDKAEK